ncbi:MAG TPA: sulfate transporter [Acidimicrobiia bacterium]
MGAPEESPTILVVVGSAITRARTRAVCARIRAFVPGRAPLVTCDVGAAEPDLETVDALAQLQLTALRLGSTVRLRHARGDLRELLALTGLAETLGLPVDLLGRRGWEPEQREQPLGIEKEVERRDPTV